MARDTFGREAVAEPMAGSSGQHLQSWSERTRDTALEVLRYTRFVMVMKRALPLAAIAILGSVIAYCVMPRNQDRVALTYTQLTAVKNDLSMTKPKLTGVDIHGNPFVITAARAVQDQRGSHRATLQKVDADMQYDGAQWATASAGHGFYDMDAGTLKLGGGISIYTDTGYELHTTSAFADLKQNFFQGGEKVMGHGPLGSVTADSFFIDRDKRHVMLKGHVHMTMYPRKVKR